MFRTLLVTATVLASTAYAGPGSAVVVNGCKYDVQLSSVPAQYGGYQTTDHVLSPGQTYTQQWTQLTNGAGWSIKLSKQGGVPMQYEYTFNNDGKIWFDLSCVDGCPWLDNWKIASSIADCTPNQQYYRHSTDDHFGMQSSCSSDATLTVSLCSGESQNDGIAAALASPAAVVQSVVAAAVAPAAQPTTSSTTVAPVPSSSTSSTTAAAPTQPVQQDSGNNGPAAYNGGQFYNNKAVDTPSTTFATATTTPHAVAIPVGQHDHEEWVTVWETVIETAIAYETYVPGKRHVHHPDHPHFR